MLSLPQAAEDAAPLFVQQAGGAPANVAVAAARLEARSRFVGMLARDAFAGFLLRSLQQYRVDVDHVRRTDAAPTALAVVSLDARGERSFSFYRPPAADLLFTAADFQPAAFTGVGSFHACSNSLTEPGIAAATLAGVALAREAGALISVDVNLRPSLWLDGRIVVERVWELVAAAGLVKFSREELHHLAVARGEQEAVVVAGLLAGNAQCVVVTDGQAGVQWFTRSGQGHQRAFQVSARDTTAAGDAFMGALLAELARRDLDGDAFATCAQRPDLLRPVLRVAAAAGALAVTRQGAFSAMPSRAEVDELIEQQPEQDA